MKRYPGGKVGKVPAFNAANLLRGAIMQVAEDEPRVTGECEECGSPNAQTHNYACTVRIQWLTERVAALWGENASLKERCDQLYDACKNAEQVFTDVPLADAAHIAARDFLRRML